MPNQWIQHVKDFATKHKLKYGEALKHPECKASYASISGSGGGASKQISQSLEEEEAEYNREQRKIEEEKADGSYYLFGVAKQKWKEDAPLRRAKERETREYQRDAFVYRSIFPFRITDPEKQKKEFYKRLDAVYAMQEEGQILNLDNPADVTKVIARATRG